MVISSTVAETATIERTLEGRAAEAPTDAIEAPQRAIATAGIPPDRLLGIDLVRLLAAVAVIWVHTAKSDGIVDSGFADVGRVGTTFLNILAAFFTVMGVAKHRDGTLIAWVLHRSRRILGAWFIWGFAYAVFLLIRLEISQQYFSGQPVTFYGFIQAIGWWGSPHLWFLPYLFAVTLLFVLPVRWILARPERALPGAIAMATLGLALTLGVNLSRFEVAAFELNFGKLLIFRSPAFCYGLAIGILYWSGRIRTLPWAWVAPLAIGAVIALWISTYTGWRERTAYRVAACSVLLIGLAPWKGPIVERLAALGRLGFGVYLIHEFFSIIFERPARVLWTDGRTLSHDILLFALVLFASFAAAALLKRSKYTRWTLT